MGLNYYLGLIKILQIRLSIGQACSSVDRTRKILKSSFCSLYVLVCSQFANCSKLLEPNNLSLWQFVTNLSYKMKCSNTRTTQYNKMPNYNTNPNLRLLTQKLQEEVEGLDQNVPVFPETLNKHIITCVERKTYKQ